MTREEHKQISEFIDRTVKGADATPLPPLDIEADAIIRALFVRNREAAYRITMLAIAQSRELELLRTRLSDYPAQCRKTWLSWLFKSAAAPLRTNPQMRPPGIHPPA